MTPPVRAWLAAAALLALLVLAWRRVEHATEGECDAGKEWRDGKCYCKEGTRWDGSKCVKRVKKATSKKKKPKKTPKTGGDPKTGTSGGGRRSTGISIFNDTTFKDETKNDTQDTQNILAVNASDWDEYRGKRLRVYYKGNSIDGIVADQCVGGECERNTRDGFLIDIQQVAADKLGLTEDQGTDRAEFEVLD